MNYQISGVGAGIILVYSVVILLIIIWPLLKLLRKFRWKWIVVAPLTLVLLAAPWAEEYWIARNFALACEDAGVHVYKQVEVDGFVYDLNPVSRDFLKPGLMKHVDAKSLSDFDQAGYKFNEYTLKEGGVWHVERQIDGLYGSVLDRATARYYFKYAYQPTPYKTEERTGWKLEKLETVIVDSETGEVIGRDTKYRRTINIAEGSWRLFWGLAKTTCEGTAPKPPDLRHLLYRYVLIPTRN